MKKLSFVIPCYRSEATIGRVIDEIEQTVSLRPEYAYEIICINDCSPDNVYHVLKEISARNKCVKVINFTRNMGKYAALMAGYAHVSGEYVITLDDDCQCPAYELWRLMEPLLADECDVSTAKYREKKQAAWKNFGSNVNMLMGEILLNQPRSLRFENFMAAVEADICARAAKVKDEIEFIKQRKDFCAVLYKANEEGRLPFRVTHNDTKINNVMLDAKTRKALCVIDLDTIMPGFSVTDFGDAIRFGASTAAEDEKDLSKVWMDIDMFAAYAKGFLEGCNGQLLDSEIMLLPEGAKMMTIECGMRFLADYLQGDTYFKTHYEGHNLDRCRTQLKLVADMESKWDKMKSIVKEYCKE